MDPRVPRRRLEDAAAGGAASPIVHARTLPRADEEISTTRSPRCGMPDDPPVASGLGPRTPQVTTWAWGSAQQVGGAVGNGELLPSAALRAASRACSAAVSRAIRPVPPRIASRLRPVNAADAIGPRLSPPPRRRRGGRARFRARAPSRCGRSFLRAGADHRSRRRQGRKSPPTAQGRLADVAAGPDGLEVHASWPSSAPTRTSPRAWRTVRGYELAFTTSRRRSRAEPDPRLTVPTAA